MFASVAPVGASPLLGFADVPSWPVSIIDFHGTRDATIPYQVSWDWSTLGDHVLTPDWLRQLATAEAEGPHGSLVSWDGYYYHDKRAVITALADGRGCGAERAWLTDMDGTDGWACVARSGCRGGGEVVHCSADFGHTYPFSPE